MLLSTFIWFLLLQRAAFYTCLLRPNVSIPYYRQEMLAAFQEVHTLVGCGPFLLFRDYTLNCNIFSSTIYYVLEAQCDINILLYIKCFTQLSADFGFARVRNY